MSTREGETSEKLKNVGSAPVFIDNDSLRSTLSYPSLLKHLQSSLSAVSASIQSPIRQNYSIDSSSSLLLMPSWSLSSSLPYIGVKLVTSFPQNSSRNLPGIHASYVLFNSVTGQTLAFMDGTELTLWRTSCVSALASKFLSREDAKVLVMIGAGSLAPHLIKAHLAVRPTLKKVIIWNRRVEKASNLAIELKEEEELRGVSFEHNDCLDEIIGLGDIVSCATSSEVPIVKGEALKAGAHLDLVGSFTPSMRECDDEAVKRAKIFVDCEAALVEAGELVGAFERALLSPGEIGGRLVDLINGDKVGRSNSDEITLFKSVGSAVVDIASAQLVYETFKDAKLKG
ncbi:protein SAR DEFICIENT 4 [Macadamia integrifolia]|uniref:protein SAR DEFICIENT 4 n=1 Tax=Macadamia integrifolia TaxID=60698 RepID=UPI001C5023F4|nr:protein SAR DEFICIENT 4 [Macadamia integrifolia]